MRRAAETERELMMQIEGKEDRGKKEKKGSGFFRESFADFFERYGVLALIAAASVPVKYICFYFFMGAASHLAWVCLLSCLFVFFIFCAFKRKAIPAVIYLLISLLMFSDVLYHGYYNSYLTIKIINSAKMIGDITASIQELIKPQYFILFADVLLIFAALVVSGIRRRKKPKGEYGRRRKEKSYDIPKALQVFAACLLVMFMVVNPLGLDLVSSVSARELGAYHVRDLLGISDAGDSEQPYYISTGTYEESLDGDLFGAAEGRNLIVIQLEAFQNFAVNLEYNGQELTPFLNSLIGDGETVYFDHYYYQVGSGNTSDAEFATNNSILGTMDSYTYTLYTQNYFRGLPVLLKERGYETAAMHAYEKTFWNRENMYPSLGFDHFFNSDYYEEDEDYTGWSVVSVNDENFYSQSVEAMKTLSEPFYSFMITLSGHHPYQQKEEDCHIRLRPSEEGTTVGDYLNTVRYVDEALEQFFEELKESGLYENSIICIYGDHYGLSCTDPEIKELMTDILGEEYGYKWHFNIPLIINIPGSGVSETIHTAGGQLDFMPTVAYLLGIEKLDTIYLGQNLFTAKQGFAAIQQFLSEGSFISDDVVFSYSGDGVYGNSQAWDTESGERTDISGHEEEALKSKQYASLSEFYLKYDVLDKALRKGMSVDEILSGLESQGKPLRISMPLSPLAGSGAGDAEETVNAAYEDGYRYIEVNAAADDGLSQIIGSGQSGADGETYSEKNLMGLSEICRWLGEHEDAALILNPVVPAEESGKPSSRAADSKKTSSASGGGNDGQEDEILSDDVTRLYGELISTAEKFGVELSRCIWVAGDMEHYMAASELGYENLVIEPDMSAYEAHEWDTFFMSSRPWGIFLPERITSGALKNLSASSSEIYLVQDGAYDGAHEIRMRNTGAYGEVTFDQEPKGQTEEEIVQLLSAKKTEDGAGGAGIGRFLEAAAYVSNGNHPISGVAVVLAVPAVIALLTLLYRKLRRRLSRTGGRGDGPEASGGVTER